MKESGLTVEMRVDVPSRGAAPAAESRPSREVGIAVRDLDLFYGSLQALKRVTLDVPARSVTAIIGPSGCGKSTLLRTFNRMNDLIAGVRSSGQVMIGGQNVLGRDTDVVELRR